VLIAREARGEGALRILVAVDGSNASHAAVETLSELFDLADAEVCLIHVAETPWIHLGLEEDWETYSEEDQEKSEAGVLETELVREGEEVLERTRDFLKRHRISIDKRVQEGNPADEILGEAERGQYDLIVLGATGNRDLKHHMMGSVSFKVAWNTASSVLVVREPE
jgi:nucleotide-binding universal stress UspA family protein